jgi:hypothetical protein
MTILRKLYLLLAFLLFVTEIFIAIFVNDSLIRPFGGDFLVVILLYCIMRVITRLSIKTSALSVLLVAYTMELLQYVHVIEILGLSKFYFVQLIIGTTFSWEDMLAYTLGILAVIGIEMHSNRNIRTWNTL